MGKSPGKWIKSVLFGKKSAKSSYPKNAASEKRTSFVSNAATVESTLEYPGISDATHEARNQKNGSTELENGSSTNLARDAVDILPGDQGTIIEAVGVLSPSEQTDIVKLEQAATRAQAVFRGYLARRAFRALKGIIRLQALIRGHLVRRQAVATLRCIQAIVKFQVLIRDHQVEILDTLPEEPKGLDLSGIDSIYISEKFSRNGYFIKLIQSGPIMPLVLQYEEAEPNSVWSWLQRWSVCRFWEPPKGLKKGVELKHQKKQRSTPTIERESWRSKRTNKASLSNGDSTISQSSTDHEKSKRHQKKTLVVSQSESTQEHPQSELERVKRNLRKVSLSAEEALEKSESANEKPQRRKMSSSPAPLDASQNGTENTPAAEKKNEITSPAPEQTPVEPAPPTLEPLEDVESQLEGVESLEKQQIDGGEVVPSKSLDVVELPTEPLTQEPDELIDDEPTMEQPLSETDNNVADGSPIPNEELPLKEDQNKENQKTRRRRSLPGKQEPSPTSLENVSQNIPTTLPSYMAATESAKAKLRAQGLAKAAAAANQQDAAVAAVENNGFVRRHSLPSSSTNGKISSLSPRVQRPTTLSNGKASTRTDRSLMSSRDDKQVQQPGWRR
ncbi:protein IQ-DOMAIN 31-like [Impatiens glandulifera]|uniref:protein IQ-DOMAIN 31-like n=1 Tax=Impatiens glandulifera TaxID=253017 RepID=UPI001FB167C6|nr:protein IQ-DOMAIN 31-like [Impatiens glandulifera]XP_047334125.1 protein IQ-DOMAIN 31-like [Impatiens glandulifera]